MWLPALGSLLLVSAGLTAEEIQIKPIARTVIEERFARLRADNAGRAFVLREMFAEVNCSDPHYMDQVVKRSKLPNMICTLPGSSETEVVISAHYDKVNAGEGAIDNWSGASLLPSLYESLSSVPRRLTFVFALFADEERGLVGSRSFVAQLSKEERRRIAADINIDSIGLPGAINIWASRADPGLVNATALVASSLRIVVHPVNVDRVGESDSRPFRDIRVPVIDFHSITQSTFSLLHTSHDIRSAVDGATYYDTYRLLSALLAYLDVRETGRP